MLAVTLGHTDSAVILLQHEANVNTENTQGWSGNLLLYIYNKTFIFLTNYWQILYFISWQIFILYFDKFYVTAIKEYIKIISLICFKTVVQEAVGTGNPDLLQLVLARRDYQRYCNRVAGIPELLHKLKQVSH